MNDSFIFRKWAWRLLGALAVFYGLILLIYFLTGGFDFTLPLAGRIYLNHWLRPYQIILACLALMGVLWVIPAGALAGVGPELDRGWEWARERKHGFALALIVLIAMFLRLWSLGHGIPEYIFWIDAPQLIEAAQEYLKGNYAYETGYPFFASHLAEWGFLLVNWWLDFMGFSPMEPESNVLSMVARGLNLIYVLGIMGAIYFIGAAAGLRSAGTLTAFFLAVSTISVQMSHYFINDMAMSFFSLLAMAVISLNLKEERLRWYLLFGILTALSFVCKYNGVLGFIFMGFLYLQKHWDWRSFTANLDKPVKAALICILTYLALTPTVWTAPQAKLILSQRIAGLIAEPRGVRMEHSTGVALVDHAAMLFADWPYHLWVLEALFHPLPLWLGAAAFAYGAYRRRWSLFFIWAGAITAFLFGKTIKPNAAGWHFLNISPFFLFMAAVGVTDALARIGVRRVRESIYLLVCGLLLLAAAQDASFWSLPPSKATLDRWVAANIGDEEKAHIFPEYYPEEGERRTGVIQEIQSGAAARGYSTLRELYWYVKSAEGQGVYFPLSLIATNSPESQIFPQNHDLITTERVFATGPGSGTMRARRYILAEKASGQIAVLAKNAHDKSNTLRLRIGKEVKTVTLEGGGSAVVTAKTPESRTFLFKGAYVLVEASSDNDAVWMVGANHQDIGDIYAQLGQVTQAVESHANSLSAYSLLRIMAVSERSEPRFKAFAEMERRYPKLHAAVNSAPLEKITWKEIAGYSDSLFAAKARIPLPLEKFRKRNMPAASAAIPPGGSAHSPNMALTQGEYAITASWVTRKDIPSSFAITIRAGLGEERTIRKRFTPAETESGRATISFSVDSVAEFPISVGVEEVEGGPLMFEELALSIDYMAHARKVIQAGLDGVKRRKL